MSDKSMLRAFMGALTEPALLLDPDKVVLAVNSAMLESLGRAEELVVGFEISNLLPPSVRDTRVAQLDRVIASGKRLEFEDERDGRFFVNHLNPALDADGRVTAVVVFAVDVTPQRRAEKQAAESLSRYERIVATCLEGVWQIDKDNRTVLVNEQMANILGYKVGEFIGRDLYSFMDEEGRKQAEELVRRRKQGVSERFQFCLRHRKGNPVWVDIATNPLFDSDRQYVGAVALIKDVSEERALRLRTVQAQKMESLGVLAGGIAHDFNNLLVGILGNVGLAERELPQGSEARCFLEDIGAAAHGAAELTRQMLAYAGKERFVIGPLRPNELVTDVVRLLKSAISPNATVSFELHEKLPLVRGDEVQLRQVLMNLVTNASDAIGDEEGTLRIRSGTALLDVAAIASLQVADGIEEGEFVWVEVSDDGCGISTEEIGKIFDPFYSTKFTGRGLGLAAVMGILRGHGAGVSIESEMGSGSSFRVFLPVSCDTAIESEEKPAPSSAWKSTGTVLVVDDEESVREVATRILERTGFEVLACEDGIEALDVYRRYQKKIILVVLDLTMPKLGGGETFEKLVKMDPDVRVLLCSGFTEHQDDVRFDSPCLKVFLRKPYRFSELNHAVEQALSAD